MSGDSFLDQNEIERLLGGGGGAAKPTPLPAPSAPEPEKDAGAAAFLDQSELDALMSGISGGAAAPRAAAAPAPPPPAAPEPALPAGMPAVLNQSELESLMKDMAAAGPAATAPKSPPPAAAALPPLSPPPPPVAAVVPPPSFALPPLPLPTSPQNAFVPPLPTAAPPPAPPMFHAQHGEPVGDEDGIPHGDLNYLLKRANEAIQSIATTKPELPTEVIEFQFPEFGGSAPSSDHATLDQISEVDLDVKIELGRSQMYLEDVLSLRRGSVVALDKMAGDAVDIYVNGRLLARGEVLVMNENFCVRVAELLAGTIPIE